MAQLFARDNTAFLTNYIETYGPVAKIHGFFGASCRLYSKNYSPRPDRRRSALQARFIHTYDPKALHSVHVKDQESYDRGPQTILYVHASYDWMLQRCLTTSPSLLPYSTTRLLVGPGLLAAFGSEHRRQRKLLNPAFSSAHMRGLSPIFYNVAGKVCWGIAFSAFYVCLMGCMRPGFS